DRIDCITGLGIDEQHARAFGCKVLVTPGEQRHDDGTEIASPRGQDIFIARRPFAVAAALQKSRLDQSIEPSRQYVGSDPETPLKLLDPRTPVECITQNENAPPPAHPLETAGKGAPHRAKVFPLH